VPRAVTDGDVRGDAGPRIERTTVADAEEILALQRRAFLTEAELYGDHGIPPLIQTLDALRAQFLTHTVLKAVVGDAIVGSVRAVAEGPTCHITRLMVHPDHRNRGIGGRLVAIEAAFASCRRFELYTGSRSDGNLRLYARLGYAAYRTEPFNAALTFVYMAKRGPGAADA